jgi:hypothetical protein
LLRAIRIVLISKFILLDLALRLRSHFSPCIYDDQKGIRLINFCQEAYDWVKKVCIESRSVGGSLHFLYNELIDYPLEGYVFVTDEEMETANKINTFRLLSSELAYAGINDFLACAACGS